jgi:BirA family biotin operon repressor/biotin-[acetyl-CoA-carboxylase] ligase
MQVLRSTPSTMDTARENLRQGRIVFDRRGRSEPQGVMTWEQTAGRGQSGRTWHAPPGESLCATYYFRHGLAAPQNAGRIALLAGVAVAEVLQRRIPQEEPGAPSLGLKWPNDVLLNGRKVAGILIEMLIAPDDAWTALIGIGVNLAVRAFPPEITAQATSLLLEGVPPPSWQELGPEIADSLRRQADAYTLDGFAAILGRWRAYDRTPGLRYRAEWEGRIVCGIAEDIEESGALRLRLEDSSVLTVHAAASLRELPPGG